MDFRRKDKSEQAKNMKMEEVLIDKHSGFVGHRYVQHAGAAWKGHHTLQHHTYVILGGAYLKNAIKFGYGDSLKPWPKTRKPNMLDLDDDDGEDNDAPCEPVSETRGETSAVEKVANEDDHTSGVDRTQSAIVDRSLGTEGVDFVQD